MTPIRNGYRKSIFRLFLFILGTIPQKSDKSDPLHGKGVHDIPEILTSNLLKISIFERHQLTEKFVKFMSENVKQKVRLQIKLNEIEAANAISKLLLDNQFDTIFLSKAKRRFLLFEISLRIIGKIDRESLSKVNSKMAAVMPITFLT